MSNEGSLARSGGMNLSPDSYKFVTAKGDKDYNMQIIRDHFMTPQPVRWRNGPITGRFHVEQVAFGAGHILVLAYDTAAQSGPYLYAAGNNSKGQLGTCDDAAEHRELTPVRCDSFLCCGVAIRIGGLIIIFIAITHLLTHNRLLVIGIFLCGD
jgi:hypothetical protein